MSLDKKLGYPYAFLKSISGYKKSVNQMKKEDFFSKLQNKCPDDEEIERTKKIIKLFHYKNGEELTQLYLKSDVTSLADVFEKIL